LLAKKNSSLAFFDKFIENRKVVDIQEVTG